MPSTHEAGSCGAYVKHKNLPNRPAIFQDGCCWGQEAPVRIRIVGFGRLDSLVEVEDLLDRHCLGVSRQETDHWGAREPYQSASPAAKFLATPWLVTMPGGRGGQVELRRGSAMPWVFLGLQSSRWIVLHGRQSVTIKQGRVLLEVSSTESGRRRPGTSLASKVLQ